MKPFHEFQMVPEWAYDSVELTRRFCPGTRTSTR